MVSFPVGIFVQFSNIIFQGVPERFPKLRLAFLEIGCTWLPLAAGITGASDTLGTARGAGAGVDTRLGGRVDATSSSAECVTNNGSGCTALIFTIGLDLSETPGGRSNAAI